MSFSLISSATAGIPMLRTRNYLLGAIAAAAPELTERLEPVEFRAGQLIAEPGTPLDAAYFPETVVISLVTVMRDGSTVEAAAVGNEGLVGYGIALDADSHDRRTIAQVPGRAVRVPASALRAVLERDPELRALVLRFVDVLLAQTMQSVGCTKLHAIPKRCARWLLMTHDRVGSDTFTLTQQYLAFMLAVRRATVNGVASGLQRDGLIRYQRGRVTILNRAGLEASSCECYAIIRSAYDRQLAAPVPSDAPASELGA